MSTMDIYTKPKPLSFSIANILSLSYQNDSKVVPVRK